MTKSSSEGLVSSSSGEGYAPGGSNGVAVRPGIGARAPELVPGSWRESMAGRFASVRFALTVYFGTRVLLLVVAVINGALRHVPLTNELANWDGFWYRSIANFGTVLGGYPHYISQLQTNLGFFPLYPLSMKGALLPVPVEHAVRNHRRAHRGRDRDLHHRWRRDDGPGPADGHGLVGRGGGAAAPSCSCACSPAR